MAAAVKVTACEPEPDLVAIVIHESVVDAAHTQLGVVVTVVDAEPPPALALTVVGLTV